MKCYKQRSTRADCANNYLYFSKTAYVSLCVSQNKQYFVLIVE